MFLISLVSADILSIGGTGGSEVLLGYGNQIESFFTGMQPAQEDVISTDIGGYLSVAAQKITPSSERTGKFIIIFLLILLIFIEDIVKLIKKIRLKEKW